MNFIAATLLRNHGVLGINARNFEFINPSNSKRGIHVADNKIIAKKVLAAADIPLADTYAILRSHRDIKSFSWESLPNSFVIKPNAGLGGGGIMIVFGKRKHAAGVWIQADHTPVTVPELQQHVADILDGRFTLHSAPDVALIEERVKIHPILKPYSFRGVPDVRIIVYNKVPIMAMLRLPTEASRGKANLALGGIGVGVDIASGVTTTAIVGKGKIITTIPGGRQLLSGLDIPYWPKILSMAVRCSEVTGLNYLGVDVAIDKEAGPKVLEINARPGLSIQLANQAPLRERLNRIRGLKVETLEKGVAIGQSMFARQIPENLELVTGKRVVGVFEPITLHLPNQKVHHLTAKLDTGAYSSSIDLKLAKKLGIADQIVYEKKAWSSFGEETRPFINFSFTLKKERINTMASLADRSQSRYDLLIGRRDLHRFIIDPSRKRALSKES